MNETRVSKCLMTFIVLGCFIGGIAGKLCGELPKKPLEGKPPEKNWGAELNGGQLALKVDQEESDPCTPIVIKLYIRNVGKTPLIFLSSNTYRDTPLVVKDEKGIEMPLTRFGEYILNSTFSMGLRGGELDNDDEEEVTILVNRLYDMTKRGTYSITAKRKVVKRDEKGNPIIVEDKSTGTKSYEMIELTSNTIVVKVRR